MSGYIDKGDWHFLAEEFPEGAPQEKAGTHMGVYIAWIINNDLIGELYSDECAAEIGMVKERIITGRIFLINECDFCLTEEEFNDEGLAFTLYYYSDNNLNNDKVVKQYLMDYAEMFIKEPMTFRDVEDTSENYDKIKPVIDELFRSWKAVRKIYEQNEV